MPYLLRNPTPSGPIPPQPSLLQRAGQAVAAPYLAVVDGYKSSIAGAYRTWLGDQPTANIPLSDPYSGWKPLSTSCDLKVCGQAIPDGIVMTHCQVRSSMEYRPTPISEAVSFSARIGVAAAGSGRTRLTITSNARGTSELENQVLKDAEDLARTIQKKGGATEGSLLNDLNTILADRLAQIAQERNRLRFGKASSKFRKVHVGDALPRVAELRFTVMDVLGDSALLASRHDQLDRLHRLFCRNPAVKDSGLKPSGELLSEAARVTAEAVAGRLVTLSSLGLDPYKVGTWACTSFIHREVPDSDLIFVQVVLTEYESLFKSDAPKAAAPAVQSAPAPIPAAPATPTKPSYSPSGKWDQLPPPEPIFSPGNQ